MANTSDENLVPQPESEATILEPADWIRDLIRENLSVSEHEIKVLLSNMDIIDRLVKNSSTKFALFHLELTWNLDANEQEIQAKRDLDLLQRKDVPLINVVEPENIMAPSSEGKEENENDQPAMVFTDEYLRKMQERRKSSVRRSSAALIMEEIKRLKQYPPLQNSQKSGSSTKSSATTKTNQTSEPNKNTVAKKKPAFGRMKRKPGKKEKQDALDEEAKRLKAEKEKTTIEELMAEMEVLSEDEEDAEKSKKATAEIKLFYKLNASIDKFPDGRRPIKQLLYFITKPASSDLEISERFFYGLVHRYDVLLHCVEAMEELLSPVYLSSVEDHQNLMFEVLKHLHLLTDAEAKFQTDLTIVPEINYIAQLIPDFVSIFSSVKIPAKLPDKFIPFLEEPEPLTKNFMLLAEIGQWMLELQQQVDVILSSAIPKGKDDNVLSYLRKIIWSPFIQQFLLEKLINSNEFQTAIAALKVEPNVKKLYYAEWKFKAISAAALVDLAIKFDKISIADNMETILADLIDKLQFVSLIHYDDNEWVKELLYTLSKQLFNKANAEITMDHLAANFDFSKSQTASSNLAIWRQILAQKSSQYEAKMQIAWLSDAWLARSNIMLKIDYASNVCRELAELLRSGQETRRMLELEIISMDQDAEHKLLSEIQQSLQNIDFPLLEMSSESLWNARLKATHDRMLLLNQQIVQQLGEVLMHCDVEEACKVVITAQNTGITHLNRWLQEKALSQLLQRAKSEILSQQKQLRKLIYTSELAIDEFVLRILQMRQRLDRVTMLTNQTNSGKSQRLINEITDANETYRNLSNKTIENAIHSFKYGLEGSSGSITSKETQSTKTRIELLQMQLLGYEIFK